MQRFVSCAVLLSLIAACPVAGKADAVSAHDVLACDMPADLTTPSDPLTHVAAALEHKGVVSILALGSGSTVGDAGASGGPALAFHAPEGAFPYKMVAALEAMRPGARFEVTVKGGRNMTADAMLPILRQALKTGHYNLVLWQTGTVEAVHGMRPDGLRDVLEQGAEIAAQADADLVLIDPQFSRFLRANADLGPYETVLQQTTGTPDVTLFHRLDLTQTWVGNGQIDLERVSPDERDKTITLLNSCLGQALARYVLSGIAEH